MTAVTIRSVPDDVLASLKVRAAKSGKSLQTYLLEVIAREAAAPTFDELTARMEAAASIDLTDVDVPGLIEDGRERR